MLADDADPMMPAWQLCTQRTSRPRPAHNGFIVGRSHGGALMWGQSGALLHGCEEALVHWVLLHQHEVHAWHAQCVEAANRRYIGEFCPNCTCCAALCLQEDGALSARVAKYGTKSWTTIAAGVEGRSAVSPSAWRHGMLFSGP